MDTAAARQIVADALADIAPEVDLSEVDASVDFAVEADLDSMDLLSLAEAIHEKTGLDIGAGDLPTGWSLDALVAAISQS
jgi:acyl carrier protein